MLLPVPVCKYFQMPATCTITRFTEVHSVFAKFSVTDEGVHSYVYNMAAPCKFCSIIMSLG